MTKPVIILINPQMGENIGAAARAMKNFGLSELRLVAPRDGWPNPKAEEMAAGADDLIRAARIFATTADAIADLQRVYATTNRDRQVNKDVVTPKELFRPTLEAVPLTLEARETDAQASISLVPAPGRGDAQAAEPWESGKPSPWGEGGVRGFSGPGIKTAILFGPERTGLTNEDVALADAILSIPVNPVYPSLNLAQAVVVIAYEWFQSRHCEERSDEAIHPTVSPGREMDCLVTPDAPRHDGPALATKADLQGLFGQLEAALDHGHFWKAPEKKPVMWRNIRATIQRARFTAQDVRTIRGIIKCLTTR